MQEMMKRLLFAALMLVAIAASAQKPIEMNLWPEGPKTSNGDPKDMAKIWVYLPNEKVATGRAVVCCPGGGYSHLAMDHEGHEWAPFFNGQGIALIVVKYRMPHGVWQVPAEDADALPNFQILFYPVISMEQGVTHQGSRENLLGKKPKRKLVNDYCNEQHIGHHTPRAFIVLAHDDRVVLPINSVNYYEELYANKVPASMYIYPELYANKVPASMYIYPTGGHGFGIRQSFEYHLEMMLELKAWLRSF